MPPPETSSATELAQLFSLLHDGVIDAATRDERDLVLQVEIRYLAQRIDPSFVGFCVRLRGVESLTFCSWPKIDGAAPETWHDEARIFTPPLDILEGRVLDDDIELICNQPAREAPHCGGTLRLRATSATIADDAGRYYSLAELRALSDGYWSDWRARHAAKPAAG